MGQHAEMCATLPGERLVEELAPELVPMLTALEMPANFVPVTNAVLSEMARRGVSRDKILATLRVNGERAAAGHAAHAAVGAAHQRRCPRPV